METEMEKPRLRLLDLFCGEGVGALGYLRHFDVVGVDSRKSCGRYYPGDFVHGDALQFLQDHGPAFDIIHASPPCQGYSVATVAVRGRERRYPRLISAVRDIVRQSGTRVPLVIENVEGAARDLHDPVVLCGTMFGLEAYDSDGERLWLKRHRLFEITGVQEIPQPGPHDLCRPGWSAGRCAGVYGGGRADKTEAREVRRGGYSPKDKATRRALLGLQDSDPDFTHHGLNQAIPPAYTNWVSRSVLRGLALQKNH